MSNSNIVDVEIDLSTEQVPRADPRSEVVSIDPERMSGTPCFVGTRVPVSALWDYLADGETLDEFLDCFPSVDRSKAISAIQMAGARLLDGITDS